MWTCQSFALDGASLLTVGWVLDNTGIHRPGKVQTREVDRGLKSFSVPNTHTLTHTLSPSLCLSVAVPLCLFNTAPTSLSTQSGGPVGKDCKIASFDSWVWWWHLLEFYFLIYSSFRLGPAGGSPRRVDLCAFFLFFLVRNEPPFRRRACSWPQPDEYSHKWQRAGLHKPRWSQLVARESDWWTCSPMHHSVCVCVTRDGRKKTQCEAPINVSAVVKLRHQSWL